MGRSNVHAVIRSTVAFSQCIKFPVTGIKRSWRMCLDLFYMKVEFSLLCLDANNAITLASQCGADLLELLAV